MTGADDRADVHDRAEGRAPFAEHAHETSLPAGERTSLRLQSLLGRGCFAVVGPAAVFAMRIAHQNRIEGLEEARRVYRGALASGRPTLICANHLTMVDSPFLQHAFASLPHYLRDWKSFPWNVPAVEHIRGKPLLRAMTFLGKCVTIDRSGDEGGRKRVLARIKYLASRGEIIMLFPEGGRSRTGRVELDSVQYGVGHILKDLDRPQVICAYLRGDKQEAYSSVPAFGDTLRLRAEILEPKTTEKGLRAARDLSRQVIAKLKSMEDAHFGIPAAPGAQRATREIMREP